MNDYTVVILEKMTTLAYRMRKVLEGSRVCVVDTDDETKLLSKLSNESEGHVSLVILDLDIEQDYAMDLLVETKKRVKDTPVIVLTPGSRKNFFVEAMLQGATDFVIKPFKDQTLLTKVFKYLMPEPENQIELVALDLHRYIRGELHKAEKGSFPVSLMFLHFENAAMTEINDTRASSIIFNDLKELFWDTDIFIRFASKYYLGVFPFCDEKNTQLIDKKMNARFNALKRNDTLLADYKMLSTFVSYPFDTSDTTQVYSMLINRIHENFENILL